MSKLLTVHQVDQWQQFNPHIVSGYRPRMSTRAALRSFFEWHNESMNIWSHSLAACFILYLALFPPLLDSITDLTTVPLYERRGSGGNNNNNNIGNDGGGSFFFSASSTTIFRSTCLIFFPTFICSVIYHLFIPCAISSHSYQRLLNCDLISILTSITGSSWSFLYRGNACAMDWNLYICTVILCISYLLVLYCTLFTISHELIGRAKIVGFHCIFRFFILLWIELPKVQLQGYHQALYYHIMSYLFIIIGGIINILRFPEKQLFYILKLSFVDMTFQSRCYQWIKRYIVSSEDIDFMWNSHNLWHYCVILSVTMMIFGCYYDLEEFELARC